jgi:hypothetical protein
MLEFLGTPVAQEIVSILLLVWGLTWELVAMWRSAKKGHWVWFILIFAVQMFGAVSIVFAILGSFGILPIVYMFFFSRFRVEKNKITFDKWKFNKGKEISKSKK